MQFRLVKTGRSYSRSPGDPGATIAADATKAKSGTTVSSIANDGMAPADKVAVGPIIVWTGTPDEYLSLLVLREADLVVARAQLTGNEYVDWYAKNKIVDLEMRIADLRKLLAEAKEKQNGA
jgi:hypothetical protein